MSDGSGGERLHRGREPNRLEVPIVAQDENVAKDMPMSPAPADLEGRPLVAEDVVAAYVADAVRGLPGVVGRPGSPWETITEKVHVDVPTKGVAIHQVSPGLIDVDVHVKVAWGVVIPDLAAEIQDLGSRKVDTLLDTEVRQTTLHVDAIEAPPEAP